MTLATNIKGYINGDERGVYEPSPSLLTYEEIVAMATAEGQPRSNTVSELNLNPSEYYTMLNEGNHLSEGDAGETVYYITGIEYGGNMEKLVIVMEQNRAYTTYVMD